jgi:hypothetical protein
MKPNQNLTPTAADFSPSVAVAIDRFLKTPILQRSLKGL